MLNYIRAEFYKVFHRKYTWITLIIVLVLEALWVSCFVFTNAHGNDYSFAVVVSMVGFMLGFGFVATLLTGDMVFAGQYKNATLKNEVSFGLSRSRIYLGKLIVQTVLSVLFCIVMMGFYVGLSWLTMPHDPTLDAEAMRVVGYYLAVSFPLWAGVQALTCAAMFLIGSGVGAVLTSLCIFMVLPQVMQLAALLVSGSVGNVLMTVYKHMPTVMVSTAAETPGIWSYCGKAWIVGAIWFVGFTVIGLIGFRNKEIK